jgi:DegV family protein with EDD domain
MVGKIRIVTDSSAQFSDPSIPARYGITIVPQTVQIGTVRYQEGVSLESAEYYRMIQENTSIFTAHHPATVNQFVEVYGTLYRETDTILSIHLSRAISKTWDHAQEATRPYLGRCSITVLDSMSCSVGLGALVETAARLVETGASAEEVAKTIRKRTQTLYAAFYTESLETIQRVGLLSEAHSLLSDMLNLRPFLTIEEGELHTMEKVRTRVQAIEKLIEFAAEFELTDRLTVLYGVPSNLPDFLRVLRTRLEEELNWEHYAEVQYCPTLGTFIGAQGVGLLIVRE